ncbi:hypothetical protein FAGKG844_550028 [Frankia sp. AgKG'84/4]
MGSRGHCTGFVVDLPTSCQCSPASTTQQVGPAGPETRRGKATQYRPVDLASRSIDLPVRPIYDCTAFACLKRSRAAGICPADFSHDRLCRNIGKKLG